MSTLAKEPKRRDGSTTSDLSMLDWESQQNTFLVCVHNVAQDQPYSILQAPVSSTAQDIITQVSDVLSLSLYHTLYHSQLCETPVMTK